MIVVKLSEMDRFDRDTFSAMEKGLADKKKADLIRDGWFQKDDRIIIRILLGGTCELVMAKPVLALPTKSTLSMRSLDILFDRSATVLGVYACDSNGSCYACSDVPSVDVSRGSVFSPLVVVRPSLDAAINIEDSVRLREFQSIWKDWAIKNFGPPYRPDGLPFRALLGMQEELGELCHAHLKQSQGIRGTAEEHEIAGKDAVGDLFIFMVDYCNGRGWDLEQIITETASQVIERDWTANKTTGVRSAGDPGVVPESLGKI